MDPVIADGLIGIELYQSKNGAELRAQSTYDEGVALSDEYLNFVNCQRQVVHAVDFDDSHVMPVYGKVVARIAGHADQPEPVSKICALSQPEGACAVQSYRLPCSTVITDSGDAGPPA